MGSTKCAGYYEGQLVEVKQPSDKWYRAVVISVCTYHIVCTPYDNPECSAAYEYVNVRPFSALENEIRAVIF